MNPWLVQILFSANERRVFSNCVKMNAVFTKLIREFGSTQEAIEVLGRIERALTLETAPTETQHQLMVDYPNFASALRAWHELQILEFQSREFPLQLVTDHLNGLEATLRRLPAQSDEDVLKVFHRLDQTKHILLLTALTKVGQKVPVQAVADMTLAIQFAKLAKTSPSARPDWLPDEWKSRSQKTFSDLAKEFWQDSSLAFARAPNLSVRLKAYFLIASRLSLESLLRRNRLSLLRRADITLDETIKLALHLFAQPIQPLAHADMQMIVRHQLARISRSVPEVRNAIRSKKLNDHNWGKPSTYHSIPTDIDRLDSSQVGIETTSS